ncbi:26.5 kDa heat shock protein, mitochondrial [Aristolochia californica]|uniref:26.5 kDa heat shock protein, mitochondrial n=1 Tax=Aristolochia californica TaxID=171875 RepID=UPI0035DE1F4D
MAMARLFTKNLQQRVVSSLCENNSPIASRTVGAPKQRWGEALRRFSTASEEAKASEGEHEITVSEGRQKSKLAPRKRRGLWRSGRGLAPSNLGDIVPRSLFNLTDNLSRMLDNLAPSQLFGRLKEDDKCYKLRLEVPGLSKEDLKITLEGGFLNIKGEHKEEEEEGSDDEQWGYRSYGYYNSSLLLPPDAKPEDIKAELKNGVLHLTIPRKENQAKDVTEVTIQ